MVNAAIVVALEATAMAVGDEALRVTETSEVVASVIAMRTHEQYVYDFRDIQAKNTNHVHVATVCVTVTIHRSVNCSVQATTQAYQQWSLASS